MKTKNIFRMLLVAAALLLGANNVKADEIFRLWTSQNGDAGTEMKDWTSVNLGNSYLQSISEGDVVNFYGWVISSENQRSVGLFNHTNNAIIGELYAWQTDIFPNGVCSCTITKDQATMFHNATYIELRGQAVYVTKVEVIHKGSGSGGGSSTTDTPVWTGNQWLNNWQYYQLPSGTFNSLKCDGTDVIRVYGNLGNLDRTQDEGKTILYGIELVADWNDSAKKIKHTGTDNFAAGYYDFTNVSSTLANALKSNGIINGYNFYVTSIVINPTTTSSVITPTLSFPQSNYSVNYGQSFTAPTLTKSVDGLKISYSSDNSNVAEVDASTGAITIKGVGSAVITATSAAVEDTYNSANASYTLTVNKGTATISNAGITLTFGSPFAAPTTNPANLSLSYSNSTNTNVAVIDDNGNVVPVGAGTANITATFAGNSLYNQASTTFQLTINEPTKTGAIWNGAAWLGNYTIDGVGTHPQIPTTNLKSAQVGDNIRFYGKLGPLSATDWRCEVHGDPWSNQLGEPSGNDSFTNGYFDLPITGTNIGMLMNTDNLTLNGYNLTITAVELIPSGVPAKQNVTLSFTTTTVTATMGESDFLIPTLVATVDNQTVTGLDINYVSSNTNVATVDPSTGAISLVGPGITIITASFNGDDDYNAAQSVSYRLTVLEAAPSEDDYIDVDEENHAISFFGYRTYVTEEAVDFSRSIGVEGYYATGVSGTEVQFTQVTGVCPEDVPLLLKAKSGATEYKLLKTTASATAPSPNKLVAGPGEEVKGANKYVLTVHSNEVVFAEVNLIGAVVDPEHAYLDLNGSNARGRLTIRLKGESTGISNVETETIGDDVIYNLRGQRVEHPTKGLYIINGKKVVIK